MKILLTTYMQSGITLNWSCPHPLAFFAFPAPDWKTNNTEIHDEHKSGINSIWVCRSKRPCKSLPLNNSFHSCPFPSVCLTLSSLFLSLLYRVVHRKCMECVGTPSQAFILKFTLCSCRGVLVCQHEFMSSEKLKQFFWRHKYC